jgi:hypothetical protein
MQHAAEHRRGEAGLRDGGAGRADDGCNGGFLITKLSGDEGRRYALGLLIGSKLKVVTVGAPIDFLLILCYLLPLPDVESNCNNQILLDLLSINFLGSCIEKGRHCRSLWDVSGHHGRAALLSSGNGTAGLEQSCKGFRVAALCEIQNNLIISGFGYNPFEDGTVVAVRIVVIWSSAVLSGHNDRQETNSH